jgi:hypothetical protein
VRNRWFVSLAVVWFVVPLLADLGNRTGWLPLSSKPTLVGIAGFGLATALGAWFSRAEVLRNAVGRRLVLGFLILLVLLGVLRVAHGMLGLPRTTVMMPEMLLDALGAVGVTLFVDPRFVFPAVVYPFAALAVGAWPDQALRIAAVANLVGVLPIALFWKRLEPRSQPAKSP